MILEALFSYINTRNFLYQLLATLVTFAIIRVAALLWTRQKRFKIFKHYNIPHPETSIIDGNFHAYANNKYPFLVDQAFIEKYGKLFGHFIGDEPSIITTDLDILRKVFLDGGESFRERSTVFMDIPISDGILFAKYPRWRFMRKLMSPTFSRYAIKGHSSSQFVEITVKLMLDYIDRKRVKAEADDQKLELDIHDLMKSTSLHLISAMAANLPNVQVKEKEEYVSSLDGFLAKSGEGPVIWAIKFPLLKPLMEFLAIHIEQNATLGSIHRVINKMIDEKPAESSQNEKTNTGESQGQISDVLIRLYHQGKLTRNELVGNIEAILIAGYDTTSTTLTYVFWALAKHQDVQETLRTDLIAHGTDSKYLLQVINEVMRLYPTVINFATRLATKTVEINGWTIPQGTKIIYNTWLIHRNPEFWPDPLKFDPTRFDASTNIHPCAFAPFGIGERKCIGYQLAMLELRVIVCEILLRYRVKLISPENLELVNYAVVLTKPSEKIVLELERL